MEYLKEDPILIETLKYHKEGSIKSISYNKNQNNEQIGSTGSDGLIYIYNKKKKTNFKLVGHTGEVNNIKFSNKNQYIVTCGKDNSIRVWENNVKGQSSVIKQHQNNVREIDISCDDQMIVSCSDDKTIKVFNVMNNNRLMQTIKGSNNWIRSVRFSNDSRLVCSGGDDKTVNIFDIETKESISSLLLPSMVQQVQWSPDNSSISALSHNQIKLIDTRSTSILQCYDLNHVSRSAFHPSGHYLLASTLNHQLKIYDLRQAKLIYTLLGHNSPVLDVAFSQNGNTFLSASADNIVLEWNFNHGITYQQQQFQKQQIHAAPLQSQLQTQILSNQQQSNYHQSIQQQNQQNPISYNPLQINQTLDQIITQLDVINNTLQIFEQRIGNSEEQISSLNLILNEKLRLVDNIQENLADLSQLQNQNQVKFQRAPNYN